MSSEFSRAACIRRIILENPTIQLDELRKKYKAEYGSTLPDQVHLLYMERSNCKKKLGDDLEAVPLRNGKVNVTAFVRDFCVESGETEPEARRFCGYFGIEMSASVYRNAVKQFEEQEGETSESDNSEVEGSDSPDENQDKGPRARKLSSRGRVPGKRRGKAAKGYEDIEDDLDKLIQKAGGLKDEDLIQTLKDARRRVGAIILDS